jgi:ribonuclease HII
MGPRATHRKNVVVRNGRRTRLPDIPHLRLERELWSEGLRHVVGVDEVGVGSWAGPLSVGAVVHDPCRRVYKVRDSKILDPVRRADLAPRIERTCLAWGVGHATVEEIDRHGLSEARRRAARRALDALGVRPDYCLVDGNWDYVGLEGRTRRVIHGDAISLSIACASVVAKVARDRIMTELSASYPVYDWASNKGYPSPRHKAALAADGPCPLHRRLFAPIAALSQLSLFPTAPEDDVGQPMGVTVKETLDPHVRVFDTDRWLTGVGGGLFERPEEAPEGSMARMVLDTGEVESVHIFGNCVTVTKGRNASWDDLSDRIQKGLENFYIFYPENIGRLEPPTEVVEEAEEEASEGGRP